MIEQRQPVTDFAIGIGQRRQQVLAVYALRFDTLANAKIVAVISTLELQHHT